MHIDQLGRLAEAAGMHEAAASAAKGAQPGFALYHELSFVCG